MWFTVHDTHHLMLEDDLGKMKLNEDGKQTLEGQDSRQLTKHQKKKKKAKGYCDLLHT